ncbi:uncharacterized protein LOC118416790 [Branchiostoma floridae]|uniref:Uncharacterized protein LOC118416790 n=1 Tax=Branchiostoma floridae TaxID=7739 RepID=A0A9J7MSA7_BRAFL|nr:uncharacterized protein LOC118416790 [Branchiostoma floridae]
MDLNKRLAVVFLLVAMVGTVACLSSKENLQKMLVDHFSANRNHHTGKIGKQSALQYVYDTFIEHDLQVFTHTFDTDNPKVKGKNLIGVWPGTRAATKNDRPILIAAHYDSYLDTPGVCADGSGMAALLEAIRVITARTCIQYNSIIFAAFDFEEKDTTTQGSACRTFGCGSRAYVSEVLVKYLKFVGISSAQFQGAFILDSILNFNDSVESQKLPLGDFQNAPGLQDAYNAITAHNRKGDFVTLVGRDHDSPLYQEFMRSWSNLQLLHYKDQLMRIPLKQVPPVATQEHYEYWPVYRDLTYGDHYSFWQYDSDLRAIHITDTGPLRGYMQECYHKACDNTDHLNQQNMLFLKKVTDATIDAAMTLAVFPETCKDPWENSPEMLKSGIYLQGKVWGDNKNRHGFTLHLKEFKRNGAVVATIKNGTVELDLDGRYNADSKKLILRMAQPSNTAALPVKYDPVYLMKWTMTGELVGFAGGILYYGFLAGPNNDPEEFSITYSEDPSVGPNQANVVLGVLLLIAIIAIIAFIAYIVYIR